MKNKKLMYYLGSVVFCIGLILIGLSVFVVSLIFAIPTGLYFGYLFLKGILKKEEKEMKNNAVKVFNGEKENMTTMEGLKQNVNSFKLRNERDEEIKIYFGR